MTPLKATALTASIALLVLAAATPWVSAGPRAVIEMAFETLCHQRADRSFSVGGIPFGVCQRCFGIYAGIALGLGASVFLRGLGRRIQRHPVLFLAIALAPLVLDVSLDVAGILANTPATRFGTGLLAGIAGGLFLGYALDGLKADGRSATLQTGVSS